MSEQRDRVGSPKWLIPDSLWVRVVESNPAPVLIAERLEPSIGRPSISSSRHFSPGNQRRPLVRCDAKKSALDTGDLIPGVEEVRKKREMDGTRIGIYSCVHDSESSQTVKKTRMCYGDSPSVITHKGHSLLLSRLTWYDERAGADVHHFAPSLSVFGSLPASLPSYIATEILGAFLKP